MKKTYLLALLLASLALFLSGCASKTAPPSPELPSANITAPPNQTYVSEEELPDLQIMPQPSAPVNRTEGIEVETTPTAPSCTIALDANSITEGGSVGVTATAVSSYGQPAVYLCGNEEKNMGVNGFFNRYSTCTFTKAGEYDIYVKVGGQICASKKLVVNAIPKAVMDGKCSLVNDSIKKNYSDMYFEAAVNFSGYAPNATLKWECGWRNYMKKLGTQNFGSPTAEGIITIYCKYTDRALLPSAIKVSVDGDECGQILVQ